MSERCGAVGSSPRWFVSSATRARYAFPAVDRRSRSAYLSARLSVAWRSSTFRLRPLLAPDRHLRGLPRSIAFIVAQPVLIGENAFRSLWTVPFGDTRGVMHGPLGYLVRRVVRRRKVRVSACAARASSPNPSGRGDCFWPWKPFTSHTSRKPHISGPDNPCLKEPAETCTCLVEVSSYRQVPTCHVRNNYG